MKFSDQLLKFAKSMFSQAVGAEHLRAGYYWLLQHHPPQQRPTFIISNHHWPTTGVLLFTIICLTRVPDWSLPDWLAPPGVVVIFIACSWLCVCVTYKARSGGAGVLCVVIQSVRSRRLLTTYYWRGSNSSATASQGQISLAATSYDPKFGFLKKI